MYSKLIIKKKIYKTLSFIFINVFLLGALIVSYNFDDNLHFLSNEVYAATNSSDKAGTSASASSKNDKKQDSSTSSKAKEEASSSIKDENPSNNDDIEILARLINGEARGEPYIGQVAVGAVILNRVASPEFPNTISGVIYQSGQFSCVTDGNFNAAFEDEETVMKAAREAINGSDPVNRSNILF